MQTVMKRQANFSWHLALFFKDDGLVLATIVFDFLRLTIVFQGDIVPSSRCSILWSFSCSEIRMCMTKWKFR